MTKTHLSVISTFCALLPIIAGFFAFKKSSAIVNTFLLFFLIGFTVDMSIWQLSLLKRKDIAQPIFYLYVLIEPLWFTYFIAKVISLKKQLLGALVVLLSILWFVAHVSLDKLNWLEPSYTDNFNTFYNMLISVMSGYALLKFSQNPKNMLQKTEFWFMVALFVYCFSTFFLNKFILSGLLDKIWFLHNTMNIISSLIFAYGFYISGKKNHS